MLTATAAHLPQVPQEVPQAILERVERLLSTEDGVFDRSVGQVLAKEITDGLLIDIQGAVNAAADAATPKLSGLARKRLMVWVVIDAVSWVRLQLIRPGDASGCRHSARAPRCKTLLMKLLQTVPLLAPPPLVPTPSSKQGSRPSSRRSTRPRR